MRSTQLQAYDDLKPDLSNRREEVLRIIREHGGAASFQISEWLHWPINSVSGRVTELCDLGFVHDSGERILNPHTQKRAILWRIVKRQPVEDNGQFLMFDPPKLPPRGSH